MLHGLYTIIISDKFNQILDVNSIITIVKVHRICICKRISVTEKTLEIRQSISWNFRNNTSLNVLCVNLTSQAILAIWIRGLVICVYAPMVQGTLMISNICLHIIMNHITTIWKSFSNVFTIFQYSSSKNLFAK